MNPVIGLDLAKGESFGQIFLDKAKPHGNSFCIQNTSEGLAHFHEMLREVESLSGTRPGS
ncbi:hypothetical protein ACOJUR_04840 [Alicyclobacillus tolerans]|uniref:hypothetical protein n=1 Tax=Alicyclobacillus tolerans TaxID=90970 RepID=UPI003B81653B